MRPSRAVSAAIFARVDEMASRRALLSCTRLPIDCSLQGLVFKRSPIDCSLQSTGRSDSAEREEYLKGTCIGYIEEYQVAGAGHTGLRARD